MWNTDIRRYDDTEEDGRWDPVWDVATSVDAEGWSAEFRIPYSQIRFGGEPVQTWGIQFHRDLARVGELSLWAPTLPEDEALVSRFGTLEGIEALERPLRLEAVPYAMARLREGVVPGDPAAMESHATAGVDLKYGVASNFTLDVTVNPDFGQVEADPAQVNLTAFENFYPERRPFFQEAADLFDFRLSLAEGDEDLETLFYSRRIGRQPQGYQAGDPRFASPSEQTTILGAAKLSGRTGSGWSLGVLAATTDRESARLTSGSTPDTLALVEPRAGYSVVRVVKDLREGRSAVGFIGTGVRRAAEGATHLGLPTTSLAGGVDFRHRFSRDRWQLWGWAVGSRVAGDAEAITRIQTNPVHLFQRSDASHLEVDPLRTSLAGVATTVRLHRIAGGPWRGGVGLQTRSPGFDVGDVGFQRLGDMRVAYAELGYERSQPHGPFRRWEAYTTHWGAHTGGGERSEIGGNLRGEFTLMNLWGGWWGVEYNLEGMTTWLLRGGPAFRREGEVMGWGGFHTDGRRRVSASVSTSWSVRPESDSWRWGVSPTVTWRPTPVATFRVGPFVSAQAEDRQWVGAVGEAPATYVFGRLKQRTAGATVRADMAFSPTLSLQLFAQPFVSAGAFQSFRRVADPQADRYADRFAPLAVSRLKDGGLRADLDGDGLPERYDDPDFNFRRLRTNLVLRWEYLSGSTLYVVWSQGREDVVADGTFRLGRDLDGLFRARADDAFMVKLSYWWTP